MAYLALIANMLEPPQDTKENLRMAKIEPRVQVNGLVRRDGAARLPARATPARPVSISEGRPNTSGAGSRGARLAAALGQLNKQVQGFLKEEQAEYVAQQEDLARNAILGMTFDEAQDLVQSGHLAAHQNPWYHAAFDKAYGLRAAEQFQATFLQEAQSLPLDTNFEEWSVDRLNTFREEMGGGRLADAGFREGLGSFMPDTQESWNQRVFENQRQTFLDDVYSQSLAAARGGADAPRPTPSGYNARDGARVRSGASLSRPPYERSPNAGASPEAPDARSEAFDYDPLGWSGYPRGTPFDVIERQAATPEELDAQGIRLSRHYSNQELTGGHAGRRLFLAPQALRALDAAVDNFGEKIPLTSTYRSPSVNRRANGARYSYHQSGDAFDIPGFQQMDSETQSRLLSSLRDAGFTQFMTYDSMNHLHVDIRDRSTVRLAGPRWSGVSVPFNDGDPVVARASEPVPATPQNNISLYRTIRTIESSDRPQAPRTVTDESTGRPITVSGVSQMVPGTARAMAERLGIPFDDRLYRGTDAASIAYQDRLGQAYVDHLMEVYNDPLIAGVAYHQGETNMNRHLVRIGDPRSGEISADEFVRRLPPNGRQYAHKLMRDGVRFGAPAETVSNTVEEIATSGAPETEARSQLLERAQEIHASAREQAHMAGLPPGAVDERIIIPLARQLADEGNVDMVSALLAEPRIGSNGEVIPPITSKREQGVEARRILDSALRAANAGEGDAWKAQLHAADAEALISGSAGVIHTMTETQFAGADGSTTRVSGSDRQEMAFVTAAQMLVAKGQEEGKSAEQIQTDVINLMSVHGYVHEPYKDLLQGAAFTATALTADANAEGSVETLRTVTDAYDLYTQIRTINPRLISRAIPNQEAQEFYETVRAYEMSYGSDPQARVKAIQSAVTALNDPNFRTTSRVSPEELRRKARTVIDGGWFGEDLQNPGFAMQVLQRYALDGQRLGLDAEKALDWALERVEEHYRPVGGYLTPKGSHLPEEFDDALAGRIERFARDNPEYDDGDLMWKPADTDGQTWVLFEVDDNSFSISPPLLTLSAAELREDYAETEAIKDRFWGDIMDDTSDAIVSGAGALGDIAEQVVPEDLQGLGPELQVPERARVEREIEARKEAEEERLRMEDGTDPIIAP